MTAGENSGRRVKVIYIAGWGRSGTTIVDRILGQVPGFFSMGEMRYLWDRNLLENRLCGCGEKFSDCRLWQGVMQEAFGGMEGVNAAEMLRLREACSRTRHVPLMITAPGRRFLKPRMEKYLAALEKLYHAIPATTGARVVVDSSKFPTYAMALQMIPSMDLYMVHMVRDPRAVAHSWLRRKLQPDTGKLEPMKEHGKLFSSVIWNSWNWMTDLVWGGSPDHYLLLRYEDFVRQPRRSVARITALVGEPGATLPFRDETTAELGINHTVSGNPNRFQTGPVPIRADDEWRSKMKPRDKLFVHSLTWPWMLKYGYK